MNRIALTYTKEMIVQAFEKVFEQAHPAVLYGKEKVLIAPQYLLEGLDGATEFKGVKISFGYENKIILFHPHHPFSSVDYLISVVEL